MPKTKPAYTPKKKIALPADLKRFALEVVQARQRSGISQVALAKECGISKQNMNNVERGNNWTSVPVLIKLRRTLAGNDGSLLG